MGTSVSESAGGGRGGAAQGRQGFWREGGRETGHEVRQRKRGKLING